MVRIGVLAIQGAFAEHITVLEAIENVKEVVQVKCSNDLKKIDGLIIPGGESTAMALIAQSSDLWESLLIFVKNPNKYVWGTCAGLILMATSAHHSKTGGQPLLSALSVAVNRNAFGSQLGSFSTNLLVDDLVDSHKPFKAVFIRAPIIESIHSDEVTVLAHLDSGDNKRLRVFQNLNQENENKVVVAVKQKNMLGTSFHPELTGDDRFHRYFVAMVSTNK